LGAFEILRENPHEEDETEDTPAIRRTALRNISLMFMIFAPAHSGSLHCREQSPYTLSQLRRWGTRTLALYSLANMTGNARDRIHVINRQPKRTANLLLLADNFADPAPSVVEECNARTGMGASPTLVFLQALMGVV